MLVVQVAEKVGSQQIARPWSKYSEGGALSQTNGNTYQTPPTPQHMQHAAYSTKLQSSATAAKPQHFATMLQWPLTRLCSTVLMM